MKEKKLPLARNAGSLRKPDDLAIFKIKQLVVGFIDSMVYAKNRLSQCFAQDKANLESQRILNDFDNFSRNVEKSKTAQTMLFDGIYKEETPFQTLQYEASKESIPNLAQFNGQLQFDFAVSEDANFVRAITVDGSLASQQVSDDFDSLLNASLASASMKHDDGGFVYLIDKNGDFLESEGKKVKADPKKIAHIFNSPAGDFQQRCASGGLSVRVVQREPTQAQKDQANISSNQGSPTRK